MPSPILCREFCTRSDTLTASKIKLHLLAAHRKFLLCNCKLSISEQEIYSFIIIYYVSDS